MMAKPKHPTIRSLRQGQTIYLVPYPYDGEIWTVVKYRLYSHKTPLPPKGQMIEKLPVTKVKESLKKITFNNNQVFYSRKKAQSRADMLNKVGPG